MDLSTKIKVKRAKARITAEKFMTDEQRLAYREPESKADIILKRIFFIYLAAALLVYSFVMFYKSGSSIVRSGCKKPIENYFEAICDRDFDSYVESMPYEWRTDHQSQLINKNFTKYEYLDILYTDLFDTFGENMDIKLTFLSQKRNNYLTTDLSRSFYEKYQRSIDIEDSCFVEVAAHFTGSKYSCKLYIDCTVIKLKGKWYIIDAGMPRSERIPERAYLL